MEQQTVTKENFEECAKFLCADVNELDVSRFGRFLDMSNLQLELSATDLLSEINFTEEKLQTLSNTLNKLNSPIPFPLMDFHGVKKDFNNIFVWIRCLGLTTLNINGITSDQLGLLLNNPLMLNITKLNLSWNNEKNFEKTEEKIDESVKPLGDIEATLIANSANLQNLTILDLSTNDIGDDGCKAISESANLKNLDKLLLVQNVRIGDGGKEFIANSVHFKGDIETKFVASYGRAYVPSTK